jgi:predicted cation transporter
MRALPHSRLTDALVPTTGTAFPIPDGSVAPFFPALQVKVFVDGLAHVGLGSVLTPIPATAATTTVYQEADTEVVYDIDVLNNALLDHLYIYADAGTVVARVSFYG